MSHKEKRVLILWSGGVDSTVLVDMALEKKHKVYWASLECGQPHTQIRAETAARTKLEKRFLELYPEASVMERVRSLLEVDTSKTKMPVKQLSGWLFHLVSMTTADEHGYRYDEVHVGYLLNDDAAASAVHLAKAFEYACRAINGDDFDPPKMRFPLLRYRKGTLIKHLRQKGLLQHVHVCELPSLHDDGWHQCNQCPACHRHNNAEAEVKMYEDARYLGNLLCDWDKTTATQTANAERLDRLKDLTNETSEQTPQHDDDLSQLDEPSRGGPVEGDVGLAGSELRQSSGEESESKARTESDEEQGVAEVLGAWQQHSDQHEDTVRG